MKEKHVEVRHEGGMRMVANAGSGHTFVMDDAAGNSGSRPTEAVLAALAACTAMDVIGVALKKRQEVVSYRVEAHAVQRDELPDVFTRVHIVHVVEGPGVSTSAIRRCIELSALKYCPVNAMLSAGTVEVHHGYRIARPGQPIDEGEVLVTGPNGRLPESVAI